MKSVIALSRKTWDAVRAETDNDNEWLPGPNQKGVLDLPVTGDMIASWLASSTSSRRCSTAACWHPTRGSSAASMSSAC